MKFYYLIVGARTIPEATAFFASTIFGLGQVPMQIPDRYVYTFRVGESQMFEAIQGSNADGTINVEIRPVNP